MTLIANLPPSSFVSYVKELKPRYSKLMVIIALVVGKRKRIPMCNLFLYLCRRRHHKERPFFNFRFVYGVCDPYCA